MVYWKRTIKVNMMNSWNSQGKYKGIFMEYFKIFTKNISQCSSKVQNKTESDPGQSLEYVFTPTNFCFCNWNISDCIQMRFKFTFSYHMYILLTSSKLGFNFLFLSLLSYNPLLIRSVLNDQNCLTVVWYNNSALVTVGVTQRQ